ncbi:hypothetical protein HY439_01890 [Candidatus Microgenomates bacterium]|nr:hypothetical protein [Candidatus Microgenomates bacterium]
MGKHEVLAITAPSEMKALAEPKFDPKKAARSVCSTLKTMRPTEDFDEEAVRKEVNRHYSQAHITDHIEALTLGRMLTKAL